MSWIRRAALAAALTGLLGTVACGARSGTDAAAPAADVVAWHGLDFHATTQTPAGSPVRFRTTVTVTNPTRDTARFSIPGACAVQLRVYRTAARRSAVWDQHRVEVCAMVLELVRLAPGEARTWQGSATAAEILGDSLPTGRYWLTAVLRPDQQVVEVPAGATVLSSAR